MKCDYYLRSIYNITSELFAYFKIANICINFYGEPASAIPNDEVNKHISIFLTI